MKYMPSAILFEKLERKLRFDYPTEIFGQMNFEIDNSGKPYWISINNKICRYRLKTRS